MMIKYMLPSCDQVVQMRNTHDAANKIIAETMQGAENIIDDGTDEPTYEQVEHPSLIRRFKTHKSFPSSHLSSSISLHWASSSSHMASIPITGALLYSSLPFLHCTLARFSRVPNKGFKSNHITLYLGYSIIVISKFIHFASRSTLMVYTMAAYNAPLIVVSAMLMIQCSSIALLIYDIQYGQQQYLSLKNNGGRLPSLIICVQNCSDIEPHLHHHCACQWSEKLVLTCVWVCAF